MKKLIILILFLTSLVSFCQHLNVKDFGAKGNGIENDTKAFLDAIAQLNKLFVRSHKPCVLFVPAGTYIIDQTLVLNKFISLHGEYVNTTILKTKKTNISVLKTEENRDESQIYVGYNDIKDLTIKGPFASFPYYSEKTQDQLNNKSIGIEIKGLRGRFNNLHITGFLGAAISISNAYYTFINNSFLDGNAVGILIDDSSTTAIVSNNELRHNSIGIIISNGSFGNFVTNNIIESNVAKFYSPDLNVKSEKTYSAGKGIIIDNSFSNNINNNYFENHFINLTLINTEKNIISNNFVALSDFTLNRDPSQTFLQLIGISNHNIIRYNTNTNIRQELDPYFMKLGDGDYSSTIIGMENEPVLLKEKRKIHRDVYTKLPTVVR